MEVHPSQTPAHQASNVQKPKHFFVRSRWYAGKLGKIAEDTPAVRKIPAGELTYDEFVTPNVPLLQKLGQGRVTAPEVVYPNRSIYEHAASLDRARPAADNRLEISLTAPQGGETLRALATDQCLEAGVKHCRLLL